MRLSLNRRYFLGSSMAMLGVVAAPGLSVARTESEKRLVFVIQRGAADGMGTLAPTGDPDFERLRCQLAGEFAGLNRIGGMFALHPSLERLSSLYSGGELLFAPAVASAYRERSHFDGQNVLETGGKSPYSLRDGWINRLLPLLSPDEARPLALAPVIPAAMAGPIPVSSYAPSNLPEANDDLLARVSRLYAGDEQLHGLWEDALRTRMLAESGEEGGRGPAAIGTLAASLLVPQDGARIAMIETTGWDTHAQQQGRLRRQLSGLDSLVGALREGLGAHWQNTVVVIATEFGRTAAINGTQGTDHGTGSLAVVTGGKINGGRILGDWPGLRSTDLHQGRDVAPANSLEALIGGVLAEHYGIEPGRIARTVFPETSLKLASGLIA